MPGMRLLLPSLLLALHVVFRTTSACSNFIMQDAYGLTGRTMDLGTPLSWALRTAPIGSSSSSQRIGFVGFVPFEVGIALSHYVAAGLNTRGLSCDQQTLLGTTYPAKTGNKTTDLSVNDFCEWVLGSAGTAAEVKAALENGTRTVHGPCLAGGAHFVVRDATGASVVVEFLDGRTVVTEDGNDGGKTGFGVMTNEPNFAWHLENVRHAKWKQQNARPAFSMPGNFYPDERFLRIALVKAGLPRPKTHREAVQQVVHVLNTVTVPPGSQIGTDSSAGEGAGDHTMWASIWDHRNGTIYWRAAGNQNLARLRLSDAKLAAGSKTATLPIEGNGLGWFTDAAASLAPR